MIDHTIITKKKNGFILFYLKLIFFYTNHIKITLRTVKLHKSEQKNVFSLELKNIQKNVIAYKTI